jgi:phospholipid/cholesterol/gamma-HCH transport system substrate-binding protein
MAARTGDNIRLGLFVLAGILLLVVVLYVLGLQRGLFRSTVEVRTHFTQVSGLRSGNNVRFAGINVGMVTDIQITSDTSVLVVMAIREADAVHIRNNAIASLGSDGLIGNRLVNIAPGDGVGSPITNGMELRSLTPLDTDEMMRTLDRTNVNMAEISDGLRELSDRIIRPGSLVGLLADTVLAEELRTSFADLQHTLENVRSVTRTVDQLMNDVQSGKGVLGTLVSDPEAEQQVRQWLVTMQELSDSLTQATTEAGRFARGLNTPGGLGHTLSRDTVVAADVRRTIANLEKSTGTLEENMRALQRNWFFRRYFREKAREERRQ